MTAQRLSRRRKWAATAVALFLLGAQIASGWIDLWIGLTPECSIGLRSAALSYSYDTLAPNHGTLRTDRTTFEFFSPPEWRLVPYFFRESSSFRIHIYLIPLWIPMAPFALWAAWLWHRDRRITRCAFANRCVTCGYDRSGLTLAAKCPECGEGNFNGVVSH